MPSGQVRGDTRHAQVPVRLRSAFTLLVGASAVVLGADAPWP